MRQDAIYMRLLNIKKLDLEDRIHVRHALISYLYSPLTGFCHEHALILYVYLPKDDPEATDSVLTVRIRFAPPFLSFSSCNLHTHETPY